MSSAGLKKAHNLLLEIMVHLIARTFEVPRRESFWRVVSFQVRSTDSELEQNESVLLTDLDDSEKERMGFLKVRLLNSTVFITLFLCA